MKITVGMGQIEEYPLYARAGADEVFCGYVPEYWALTYGVSSPLNRREVQYYNVQIGSESELEILRKMREVYQVPVSITLNSLSYSPEQYPMIGRVIGDCLRHGFDSFIIADPGLLLWMKKEGLSERCHIILSGEVGEMNAWMMPLLEEWKVERLIFHRKMTESGMKECIAQRPELAYEAFALNEMCHFHGGFCNSMHCDELSHMCLVPYQVGDVTASGARDGKIEPDVLKPARQEVTGSGGCALCKLWEYRRIGITHLKLVSRGNYAEKTIEDIQQMKRALEILDHADSKEAYIRQMKEALFDGVCSGNCY